MPILDPHTIWVLIAEPEESVRQTLVQNLTGLKFDPFKIRQAESFETAERMINEQGHDAQFGLILYNISLQKELRMGELAIRLNREVVIVLMDTTGFLPAGNQPLAHRGINQIFDRFDPQKLLEILNTLGLHLSQ